MFVLFILCRIAQQPEFSGLLTEEEGSKPRTRGIFDPEGDWGLPGSNKRTE